MIKIKSLLGVLLLIVSVYGYAQGEAAGNDWAAMGLKGKVKSRKMGLLVKGILFRWGFILLSE